MSTPSQSPLTQFRCEQAEARIQELFKALKYYGVDLCTITMIDASGKLRRFHHKPEGEKPEALAQNRLN